MFELTTAAIDVDAEESDEPTVVTSDWSAREPDERVPSVRFRVP